jgi:hypothetical protein
LYWPAGRKLKEFTDALLAPFFQIFETPLNNYLEKWIYSNSHMNAISAIFDYFRRKKLAFFSKIKVMIKILHNLALF